MLIKSISLALIALVALYSAETNAGNTITANKCTLGLPPFEESLVTDSKKDQIIKSYEARGFHVSVLTTPADISDVEFISDAIVECNSTYFGIFATTTTRLIEASNNKIVAQKTSLTRMEFNNCNIDLFSTINALPNCQIK